jgi:hypothetical protein
MIKPKTKSVTIMLPQDQPTPRKISGNVATPRKSGD